MSLKLEIKSCTDAEALKLRKVLVKDHGREIEGFVTAVHARDYRSDASDHNHVMIRCPDDSYVKLYFNRYHPLRVEVSSGLDEIAISNQRDYLAEAYQVILGKSELQPTREHLLAIYDMLIASKEVAS